MRFRQTKGVTTVVIVLGMLLFGALGLTVASFVASDLAVSTEGLQASQAFYVAEGGMQSILMSQFVGDTNFSDNLSPTDPPFGANSLSLQPGQFWVEYLDQQTGSIRVRVTGRVGNAVRVIQQGVGQGGTGWQYVTIAGGNLSISNSTGSVSGDVGLGGNYTIDPDVTVNGNIIQDDDLTLPTIDFPTYAAMCDSTYTGSLTISSNMSGDLCVTNNVVINGNVTYTGLLYVGGNLSLNGNNIVINGTLVVEGNIAGNNRTGLQFLAQPIGEGQHMPAILTQGNLAFQNADGLQVEGMIWTDGNLSFSTTDNLSYRGSFMTGGNAAFDVMNNLSLAFDADLVTGVPGLQGVGGGQTGSMSLTGWQTY